jgi:uncharacterized protein YxjI
MVFRGRRQERREGRREERHSVHYRMRQKLVSIGDDYWIEDGDGRRAYTVDGLRDRMTVEIPGGEDLHVQGTLLDHEYTIEAGGRGVAEVSKRWFRVADTYGVEIEPGRNEILVLAVTTVIDQMTSPDR